MKQLFILLICLFANKFAIAGEIRVGMSGPLSGAEASMGNNLREGIEACFAAINNKGGIKGQKLRLIARDDGNEPSQAVSNVNQLIKNDNVIALIGSKNSDSIVLTAPIAAENGVFFLGALSGVEIPGVDPSNKFLLSYTASHYHEMQKIVDIVFGLNIDANKIALFTTHDRKGESRYKALTMVLKEKSQSDVPLVIRGDYVKNTLNVENAVSTILDAAHEPRVIIIAGNHAASSEFIQIIKQDLPDAIFIATSSVNIKELKKSLGDKAENIISMQTIPYFASNLPLNYEYLRDLWVFKHKTKPDYQSFEGYIIARLFIEALKKIEGEMTRDSLVEAVNGQDNIDLGQGMEILLGDKNNQGFRLVWPMVISDNEIVPLKNI